jgi:hypothetical protein
MKEFLVGFIALLVFVALAGLLGHYIIYPLSPMGFFPSQTVFLSIFFGVFAILYISGILFVIGTICFGVGSSIVDYYHDRF